MGLTALQTQSEIQGKTLGMVRVGEYRGATTAACFSDPQTEFGALKTSCGVYDLGFRAKISLTGTDRVRWLNGMVTNNVRDLAAGQGVYSFLLNPQGHILGDLYAYNRGESGVSASIVVDTDRSQLETILATFDHYIIMDDVNVESLSEKMTALGVAGPRSREFLHRAGIEVPEMLPLQILEAKCTCNCECLECTIVRGEDEAQESYEVWLEPSEGRKTWDALIAQGVAPVGYEALELQRIAAGIPLYGVDIRERDLPQETEQMRALNFSKGCYVGQEIVERIRSRGAVHRKFTGFVTPPGSQINSGQKITVSDKDAGEVTSVASLGPGQPTLALGYIRRELSTPGKEVRIGTTTATVSELPFAKVPELATKD
jgi:folate-binding protein YgfZ